MLLDDMIGTSYKVVKQGYWLILIRIILNDNIIYTNKSKLNQYVLWKNSKNHFYIFFFFFFFLQILQVWMQNMSLPLKNDKNDDDLSFSGVCTKKGCRTRMTMLHL